METDAKSEPGAATGDILVRRRGTRLRRAIRRLVILVDFGRKGEFFL
jgi:hypothetical protein